MLIAQMSKPGYDEKLLFRGITGITIGGVQQQWTLKDSGTFNQQSAPISIALPIGNRILFMATNSVAYTKFDTTRVQGFTDTRVSLSYILPGDKFWLTAGASFPTGKTQLASQELRLMTTISQTALGYHVPVFGQGLNGNLGLAYATSLARRVVIGLGTSYSYKGKYEPITDAGSTTKIEYDPGDEVSGNIGLDYITFSKTARVSIDITGTYFFEDKLSGQKIFQSGSRIMGFFVYALKAGDASHMLNVRSRYRLQNTFYDATTTTKYDATSQVEGQYTFTIPLNSWLVGSAVGELKYYTPDQIPLGGEIIETGKAIVGSFGPDFLFIINGSIITPMVNLRYSMGTVTIDGAAKDVNGFEAGIGLKISF
ncbi:MAG: hypothetical protein PHP42_13340 [Bacteroidota bacterium]|nr:hypothetical protein [Bacteroidota bacterium]